MSRGLHGRAKEIFLDLVDVEAAERERRLEALDDADLRREVRSLLSFHGDLGPAETTSAESSSQAVSDVLPTERLGPDAVTPSRGGVHEGVDDGVHDGARDAAPHETVPLGDPGGDPFASGRIFGGRYRVLSELGRGGMGRVLRARDLVLDEDVALKILSRREEARIHLDLLVREVRLARRITHPNVCRVFDFGEAEGEVFLSMEYVDGEDLGSLLRRIGRLPREKLLDLSHQLCAGLAAAHDAGILHRDLKPANVMIDGRGRVKITDFGIATLEAEVAMQDDGQPIAGTPAYMAPEVWDGEPSERSDIYALGLLIFEMATGTRAFDAATPFDYARRHHEELPPTPSLRQEMIDPTVEEVILRCLEKDPAQRPPSARAVSSALPGGDPLQRAVDAGETPSPETVAASGGAAPGDRAAPWLFAGLVTLLLALFFLGDHAFPRRSAFLDRPPEARAEQASAMLRSLGHPPPADGDRAFGVREGLYLDDVEAILFWYREGWGWLIPTGFDPFAVETRVTYYDPPPLFEGDVQMLLTADGELGTLKVITGSMDLFPVLPPAPGDTEDAAADIEEAEEDRVPWPRLFAAVGWGEEAAAERVTPEVLPPMHVDERRAWVHSGERLEAASYDGRVVFADLRPGAPAPSADDTSADDTTEEDLAEPSAMDPLLTWVARAAELEWVGLLLLSALLAAYHLPTGRGDLRGARRLALAVFVLRFGRWLLASDYSPTLFFLDHLRIGLGRSLMEAAITWLAYVALEPVVRRVWPQTLVAWSRLLRWGGPGAGGVAARRDPEIGRSLLAGALAGAGWAVATCVDRLAARALGFDGVEFLTTWQLETAGAGRRLAANVLSSVVDGVNDGVLALFLLACLRAALGRRGPAIVVWALIQGAFATAEGLHPAVSWLTLGVVVGGVGAWLMVRVGLLAFVTALAVRFLLETTPLTLHFGSWAAESGIWAALLVTALGAGAGWMIHRRGPAPGRAITSRSAATG